VYSSAKSGSKESKGPFGLMETVREKIDTVRGRRRSSKEPTDRQDAVSVKKARFYYINLMSTNLKNKFVVYLVEMYISSYLIF
jgi:hypothetical protein